MVVALLFFVQLQLFSLGILKLFNSLCVGSPRNPAGRPVDFLVTADLAMGFCFRHWYFAAVGGHLTLFIRVAHCCFIVCYDVWKDTEAVFARCLLTLLTISGLDLRLQCVNRATSVKNLHDLNQLANE